MMLIQEALPKYREIEGLDYQHPKADLGGYYLYVLPTINQGKKIQVLKPIRVLANCSYTRNKRTGYNPQGAFSLALISEPEVRLAMLANKTTTFVRNLPPKQWFGQQQRQERDLRGKYLC